jgi:hypothetical protein
MRFSCRHVCSYLLTLVPRSRIFLPWRWRRYVPPKRRFTQDLHGATSQKTAFFSLIQFTPSQPIFLSYILILSSYLCLDFPTGLFLYSFLTRTWYAFILSPVRPKYPLHVALLLDRISSLCLDVFVCLFLKSFDSGCYSSYSCSSVWI